MKFTTQNPIIGPQTRAKIHAIMQNANQPIAVTGRFVHHKASDNTRHVVTEEQVRELIAEQYGAAHEFVVQSPDWLKKGGTYSVRDGSLGFEPDRIAASNG